MNYQTDYERMRARNEMKLFIMWICVAVGILTGVVALELKANEGDSDSALEVESYVKWFTKCVNKRKQKRALQYAPIVAREAIRGEIDPLLLSVIISLEASWNPASEGDRGEIGLTQIMPGGKCDPGKLETPTQQIAAGVDCLVMSREICGDNLERILTKYASGNCVSKSEVTKRKMRYRIRMYKQAVKRHRK